MPTLKEVLAKQAGVPANIEKSLPAGVPKVSQIMTQVASALPVNPQLPDIPIAPEGIPQVPGGVADIIKGIEDILPGGVPSVAEPAAALSRGGYRPVDITAAVGAGPRKVMGGGYRSI